MDCHHFLLLKKKKKEFCKSKSKKIIKRNILIAIAWINAKLWWACEISGLSRAFYSVGARTKQDNDGPTKYKASYRLTLNENCDQDMHYPVQ